MKKILLILLSVIVLSGLAFVGCAKESDAGTGSHASTGIGSVTSASTTRQRPHRRRHRRQHQLRLPPVNRCAAAL